MSTTEIAGDTDRDAASETSAKDPTPRPSAEMQSHARKPGKLRCQLRAHRREFHPAGAEARLRIGPQM
ncbi:MAG: hypothetical protein AAFY58_05755, partial [Planctomycetota bacterium]